MISSRFLLQLLLLPLLFFFNQKQYKTLKYKLSVTQELTEGYGHLLFFI